ncbi:hypothetical protein [Sphaerisporangium sp. TRM90804]|uniref:hypothetical protein n=1 Tax=Sphaerisporangium sp. TRM90804 TaxID=3031113 RepID=UPI00244C3913|nr:hypothetical protein [Sphaerisporangium sp. TRM90804]MDH2427544.1 hypothetical protein [Sphaerisporangium sp. TRM90804]
MIMLLSSPAVVTEDLKIGFPPERDQLPTRGLPRFAEPRGHVRAGTRRANGPMSVPAARRRPGRGPAGRAVSGRGSHGSYRSTDRSSIHPRGD